MSAGRDVKRQYMRGPWEAIGVLLAVLMPILVGLLAMAATGHAQAPEPMPSVARPVATPASGLLVNLNAADAVQLSLVPGLTPARVRAILEWREKHFFQAPTDLMKVRGIGPATYERAKPWIAVDGPAVRGVARAAGTPATPPPR